MNCIVRMLLCCAGVYSAYLSAVIVNFPPITNSGFIALPGNDNDTAQVQASNVTFDLQGFTITASDGIVINAGLKNITIRNGYIVASNDGIRVGAGCENVVLENIRIKNALRGCAFESVRGGLIEGCDLSYNVTGLELSHSQDITVKNCTAVYNAQAGYSLISSTTNCFLNCKALSTGYGNSKLNAEIFGFVSNSGYGNIFERCIANATQGLTATSATSLIAGFAIRGSECCSQIINSESCNTKSSVQGVAVPYGILLEGTIDSTTVVTAGIGTAGFVRNLVWSPDGNYVAIAGSDTTGGTGNELQIHQFNGTNASLTPITGMFGTTGTPRAVDWSLDGYIAIAGANLEGLGIEFEILYFDQVMKTLSKKVVYNDASGVNVIRTIKFSPDRQYLAVGMDDTTSPYSLVVYQFDATKNSVTQIAGALLSPSIVHEVSWSPDGRYIAAVGVLAGGAGGDFQVLRFDAGVGKLTAVAGALDVSPEFQIAAVDWAQNGKYIAVGGASITGGTNDTFQVFSFDDATETLSSRGGIFGSDGSISSVSWSSDNQYVAISGTDTPNGNNLTIVRFNAGANDVSIVAQGLGASGTATSVQWRPDGAYIAVAGDGLTGGAGQELQIFSGIEFPTKHTIRGNITYCNIGNQCPGGIGIAGSSILNSIIGNTCYNNPQNYAFVQNIFESNFGQNPSDLQNVSLHFQGALSRPEDITNYIKQVLYKVCIPIPSQLDVIESKIDASSCSINTENIESQLDVIESKIDALTFSTSSNLCGPTAILAPTTISTSGIYCVADTINGSIAIAASDVFLDLNNYVVMDGVSVAAGLTNIAISRGTIRAGSSADALTIGNGCTNIILSDLVTQNGVRGIALTNVVGGSIESCEMTMNGTGLALYGSSKIDVKECVATCNTHEGFSLVASSTNTFINCKSIETGQGNSNIFNTIVAGFISTNGYGNIFERCIANATQAFSTTDSNSIVAGFALRGSESSSKIIESESANATTSPNGFTVPYGILCEATVEDSISTVLTSTVSGFLFDITWSPDGQYFALVGNSSLGYQNNFVVMQFDRNNLVVTKVAEALGNAVTIRAVSWSYDSQYIAVAGNALSGSNRLCIFRFNTINQSLTKVAQAITSGLIYDVVWAPNGKYLVAVGDTSLPGGNNIFLLSFDQISQTLTSVQSTLNSASVISQTVSWSANGKYIAVGGATPSVAMYTFDESNEIITFSNQISISGIEVSRVAFSYDSVYLAVAVRQIFSIGSPLLFVYKFNAQAHNLTLQDAEFPTPTINLFQSGFDWFANGELLFFSVTSTTFDAYIVYSFSRSGGVLNEVVQLVSPTVPGTIVSWSPDGEYVLVAAINSGLPQFSINKPISFASRNLIQGNTVYGNTSPNGYGFGISGSSIANSIIQNKSYDNAYNYVFATNVFDSTDYVASPLQNIAQISGQYLQRNPNLHQLIERLLDKVCRIETVVDLILMAL